MTAIQEPPEIRPDCSAVVDDFAPRLRGLELESLRALLQVLQQRLGTAAEQPCDIERAQLLGHEINNQLTGRKLRESLRKLDIPLVPPGTL